MTGPRGVSRTFFGETPPCQATEYLPLTSLTNPNYLYAHKGVRSPKWILIIGMRVKWGGIKGVRRRSLTDVPITLLMGGL